MTHPLKYLQMMMMLLVVMQHREVQGLVLDRREQDQSVVSPIRKVLPHLQELHPHRVVGVISFKQNLEKEQLQLTNQQEMQLQHCTRRFMKLTRKLVNLK
jgi:hypothetical protein